MRIVQPTATSARYRFSQRHYRRTLLENLADVIRLILGREHQLMNVLQTFPVGLPALDPNCKSEVVPETALRPLHASNFRRRGHALYVRYVPRSRGIPCRTQHPFLPWLTAFRLIAGT